MNSYNMVLTPEFFGSVKRGAFDHWIGETVPVRGTDRKIIGEATVKDVDHREDGNVYVTVEMTPDAVFDGVARVASLMRGRAPMSFSIHEDVAIPHQPKRDDDVARWIKRVRDGYPDGDQTWESLDGALDEYRARADYGLTLDDDMSQLEGKW